MKSILFDDWSGIPSLAIEIKHNCNICTPGTLESVSTKRFELVRAINYGSAKFMQFSDKNNDDEGSLAQVWKQLNL